MTLMFMAGLLFLPSECDRVALNEGISGAAASTLNATIPGRVLKNDVEPVAADLTDLSGTAGAGWCGGDVSRDDCAADAAIVGDGVFVPPSPATAGGGRATDDDKNTMRQPQPDFAMESHRETSRIIGRHSMHSGRDVEPDDASWPRSIQQAAVINSENPVVNDSGPSIHELGIALV
jgi:hypothetical protein